MSIPMSLRFDADRKSWNGQDLSKTNTVFLALFILGMGLFMAYKGAGKWWKNYRLDGDGLVVNASISEGYLREDPPLGRSPKTSHYSIDARFIPKGADEVVVTLPVSEAFFKAHQDKKNRKIVIRYLPKDVSVAEIEGERVFNRELAGGPVFVVSGLVLLVLRRAGRLKSEI